MINMRSRGKHGLVVTQTRQPPPHVSLTALVLAANAVAHYRLFVEHDDYMEGESDHSGPRE